MMFRKAELFVMALAIVVAACLAVNVDLYGMPRTLSDGEMASLRGGQTITKDHACCFDKIPCIPGTTVLCSSYGMMLCAGKQSEVWHAGTREHCLEFPEVWNGRTCEETVAKHVCYEARYCSWDAKTSSCQTGALNFDHMAPDSCQDDCP